MGLIRSLCLAAGLFVAGAVSQTVLDASALPPCALQCPLLITANSGCVPPAAVVTNQGTYQSCFCQSAFLTTLYSSAIGLCDGVCQAGDTAKIQQWYIGLCRNGQVVTPGGSNGAVTTTVAGGRTTLVTSATARSTTSGSSNASASSHSQGSW